MIYYLGELVVCVLCFVYREESSMCDGLCICCDMIMFLCSEVDEVWFEIW